jgi:hypothetical protein
MNKWILEHIDVLYWWDNCRKVDWKYSTGWCYLNLPSMEPGLVPSNKITRMSGTLYHELKSSHVMEACSCPLGTALSYDLSRVQRCDGAKSRFWGLFQHSLWMLRICSAWHEVVHFVLRDDNRWNTHCSFLGIRKWWPVLMVSPWDKNVWIFCHPERWPLAFAGSLLSRRCGLMAFHALFLGLWVRVVQCVLLANHCVEHNTFGDMINKLW